MIDEYINLLGKTGADASRLKGRLQKCEPFGEDYDAIRIHYQSILKKSGANKGNRLYSDNTIEEIIKDYKKYVEWKKSKGENQMSIETPETNEQPIIEAETFSDTSNINYETLHEEYHIEQEKAYTVEGESETPSTMEAEKVTADPVNTPPVKEKNKGGRPVSTNRSERFTLYMNADTLKDITTLANLDNLTVTDLMNNLLTSYVDKRRGDIEFMSKIERMKAEYLQNRIKETE